MFYLYQYKQSYTDASKTSYTPWIYRPKWEEYLYSFLTSALIGGECLTLGSAHPTAGKQTRDPFILGDWNPC